MVATAGALGISLFPTAKDFGPLAQAQIMGPAAETGVKTGKAFSEGFRSEATKAAAGVDEGIASAARKSQLAIESAAVKIVAARAREATAAGQLKVAEQQLAEAREKYAVGSSQLISAEEKLTAAQRNVGVANDGTTLATSRLTNARAESDRVAKTAVTTSQSLATTSKTVVTATEAESNALGRVKAVASDTSSTVGGLISQYGKLGALIGVAIVAKLGIDGVQAAAKFQTSQERLVTTAGELQSNLAAEGAGTLALAGQVGIGAQEISTGMYTVESAGFHGAEGLAVMKASAQGAKEENADLGTVTGAVTSVIRDYGLGANDAGVVTSKLVAAVSDGKTNFQDLTGSLAAVLPKASAVGLSLEDVLGALTGMTLHGQSAEQASQNLADAISHLSSPTLAMTKEMASLGLSSADLSKNLGHTGVQGTMEQISTSILQHMGPAGTTLFNAFNQSKVAAADANAMFKALPANIQSIAASYRDGTLTSAQWRAELKNVPADQRMLATSFKTASDNANGFNAALKSGGNASQTYSQAMQKATGDSASMNVALMLTGTNAAKVQQNIKDIAGATTEAGGNVKGWGDIQQTFNQKLAEVRAGIGAWVVQMGTALLPVLTSIIGAVQGMVGWIAQNKVWIGLLASVIAGAVAPIVAFRVAVLAWKAVEIVIANVRMAVILLNWAIAENPFVALGIAIAAVVGGLIYAYFHFAAFRRIVDDIGNFFKTVFLAVFHAVGDAIGWVVDHWKIFAIALGIAALPLTIIVGLVVLIIKHLHNIGDAASWLYEHAFKPAFEGISNVVKTVVDWIVSTWHKMTGPIIAEWDKISKGLHDIWGLLMTLWNVTGGRLVNLISSHMGEIRRVFEAVWNVISTYLRAVWTVISGIIGGALSVVGGIFRVGWGIISSILKVVWDEILMIIKIAWDVIKGIFMVAMSAIKGVFITAWDIIVGVLKVVWDVISGVINTAIDIIKGIIRIFIDFFTGNWSKLWQDIKNLVATFGNDIWNIIKNVVGAIWDTIKNVLGNIFNTFKSIWNDIKSAVLSIATDIWDGLKKGIQDAVDVLGKVWDGLKKAFGTPIEFVIRTILNNGLIAGINVLLKVVGLSIPNIPDPNLPTFATGGVVGGSGPTDSVHAMLTPGEGVLIPGAVTALGGEQAIHAINAMYGGGGGPWLTAGGIPGFGLGGIVSGVVGAIGSALSSLANVALGELRGAASGFFDDVVKPLVSAIPGGDNLPKQMMIGQVNKIEADILDFLGAKDKTAPAIGGQIPTGQRLAILTQALAADGIAQSEWPTWEAGLNTLITRESGWNAGAVNNWDSNAKAGHPSTGLMQTIIGTFESNRNPSLPDSMTDPVANVAAGIYYIQRRYGGIQNVQQANANAAPKGYDEGGYLPPGLWNGTRKPEPVLTDAQWAKVRPTGSDPAAQHHYHISSHDPVSVAHEIERREAAHMRARL